MAGDQLGHPLGVGHVGPHHANPGMGLAEPFQVALRSGPGEVVEARDLPAAGGEMSGRVGADEARGARDQ